jgi:glycosyltransferase involved in cell wall biosynthesis
MNLLISAYACGPHMGSEPGMAWNWIKNLSDFHKIHLITSCDYQAALESWVYENELDQKIILYFNDIGEKGAKMGLNQGDWRFYYYYYKWHKKTLDIANEILNTHAIDIVHQLNMIGFREPGFFWKIDKPSVWGPIGGLNFIPYSFLKNEKSRDKYVILLKNFLNYLQIKYSSRVHKALTKNDVVIGAVKNSQEAVKKYKNIDIPVLNETGASPFETNVLLTDTRYDTDEFNILWVGKAMFRKQLSLAFKIIHELKDLDKLKFHVVGIDENDTEYRVFQSQIKTLGIQNNVIWHGKISHRNVNEMMLKYQLFLFTSIDEGTPHVVLEAISNHLPIVCFDTCGQGECVNEKIGIKITLSNPENAVKEFAENILYLYNDRIKLKEFSKNCYERAHELSWRSKTNQMNLYYKQAIDNFKSISTK